MKDQTNCMELVGRRSSKVSFVCCVLIAIVLASSSFIGVGSGARAAVRVQASAVAELGVVLPATRQGCRAVNCNPWGYNFSAGRLLVRVAWNFCRYFACIGNFWKGKGYVVECRDTMYSKSGGRRGVCSQHGGYWRTLYAH